MIRGSVGNNITGTTILGDRIIQSIGAGLGSDTSVNLFFLVGVKVWQRGSAARSLRLIKHNNDQAHASDLDTGRWCNYSNNITTNLKNPMLITWSAQPSVIAANPLAAVVLGDNFGDNGTMTFDTPIEVQMRNAVFDPYRCVGLQMSESGVYDLDVTWIFEMSRAV